MSAFRDTWHPSPLHSLTQKSSIFSTLRVYCFQTNKILDNSYTTNYEFAHFTPPRDARALVENIRHINHILSSNATDNKLWNEKLSILIMNDIFMKLSHRVDIHLDSLELIEEVCSLFNVLVKILLHDVDDEIFTLLGDYKSHVAISLQVFVENFTITNSNIPISRAQAEFIESFSISLLKLYHMDQQLLSLWFLQDVSATQGLVDVSSAAYHDELGNMQQIQFPLFNYIINSITTCKITDKVERMTIELVKLSNNLPILRDWIFEWGGIFNVLLTMLYSLVPVILALEQLFSQIANLYLKLIFHIGLLEDKKSHLDLFNDFLESGINNQSADFDFNQKFFFNLIEWFNNYFVSDFATIYNKDPIITNFTVNLLTGNSFESCILTVFMNDSLMTVIAKLISLICESQCKVFLKELFFEKCSHISFGVNEDFVKDIRENLMSITLQKEYFELCDIMHQRIYENIVSNHVKADDDERFDTTKIFPKVLLHFFLRFYRNSIDTNKTLISIITILLRYNYNGMIHALFYGKWADLFSYLYNSFIAYDRVFHETKQERGVQMTYGYLNPPDTVFENATTGFETPLFDTVGFTTLAEGLYIFRHLYMEIYCATKLNHINRRQIMQTDNDEVFSHVVLSFEGNSI